MCARDNGPNRGGLDLKGAAGQFGSLAHAGHAEAHETTGGVESGSTVAALPHAKDGAFTDATVAALPHAKDGAFTDAVSRGADECRRGARRAPPLQCGDRALKLGA
jgi:hypothetical protein